MPRAVFILLLLSLVCVGAVWAVHPFLSPPGGLAPTSWTYADVIRDRYPVHLVNPGWLSDDMHWSFAETGARTGAVAMAIFVFVFVRHRRHERSRA